MGSLGRGIYGSGVRGAAARAEVVGGGGGVAEGSVESCKNQRGCNLGRMALGSEEWKSGALVKTSESLSLHSIAADKHRSTAKIWQ